MSKYDYEKSRQIAEINPPFYAMIMAAMRKSDDVNTAKLRAMWPEVWEELWSRYYSPGGTLPGEDGFVFCEWNLERSPVPSPVQGWVSVGELEKVLSDNSDDDLHWNGADVCDALSLLIASRKGEQ